MRWLRTHARHSTVRGHQIVYTLRPWDEHRCIFVHIPKTGGVSIAAALFGRGGNTHAPLSTVEEGLAPGEFRSYFKFCFVRNPWDRLVSAYEFLRVGVADDEYDKAMSDKIAAMGDFETFVEWLRDTEAREHLLFLPQHHYVCSKEKEMGMDFVGRFENLESDVAEVAARLGIEATLPHLNAAPARRPYREYYTPETAEIVGAVYARDVQLFGYRFGG